MKIVEPTVLMRGMTAKPTSRGFVVVDIGPEADPAGLPADVLDGEKVKLGCKRQLDGTWKLSWKYRREYLRDFDAQQGQPVFEADPMEMLRVGLRDPIYRMDLDEGGWLVQRRHGRLLVYQEPDSQPTTLNAELYRRIRGEAPPEYWGHVVRACGIGIDVSEGVSASNSSIEVFFADNFEQAAELADSTISPADLGRFAVATARFYNQALICCVRKMHGITTQRTMLDECHYTNLWHHRIAERIYEHRAEEVGWKRGETSDDLLFGRWIDAVERRVPILHSLACWQEHTQYIYDEAGRIVMQEKADLPVDVRKRHGDRVVGCALAFVACLDVPKFQKIVERRKTLIEEELDRRRLVRKSPWR